MFTIIDIAYTGGNYRRDAIVELAMLRHDGKVITDEWYSTIKPQHELSDFMLAMLHLSRLQVEKAPVFAELAPYIADFSADSVLVGLNIRFIYALLLQSFKAVELKFQRPQICLSKLISTQFGTLPAMTLSGACAHYDIPFRADLSLLQRTRTLTALFESLYIQQQQKLDKQTVRKTSSVVKYPAQISPDKIDNLPNAVGVYYFSGKRGQMLYLGKSNDIKKRVMTHFADDIHSIDKLRLKNEICDIQYRLTGSELIALLLESDEIKRYMPTYNKAQRRKTYTHGIYSYLNDTGYCCLQINNIQAPPQEAITRFSSHWQALNFMWYAIVRYGLNPQYCGIANYEKWLLHNEIEKNNPSNNPEIGNENKEQNPNMDENDNNNTPENKKEAIENSIFEAMQLAPDAYNERVANLKAHYSYAQPNMILIDKGRHADEAVSVLIEHNQYKGYAYLPKQEAHKIEQVRKYLIDMRENPDVQSIIRGYLRRYSDKLSIVTF